jgi:hypothetical protein
MDLNVIVETIIALSTAAVLGAPRWRFAREAGSDRDPGNLASWAPSS